jgi:spermidine/putrescine transport system substrate-binding protein
MQRHPRTGWKAAQDLIQREVGHRVSRREFLRRSAGTALTLPTLGSILASCSNPRAATQSAINNFKVATPDNPLTLPLVGSAIPDGMAPEKNATLQIYNWAGYMWKHVIDDFCAKYDCKYQLTTFNNMAEAVSKIQTGQLKFDVFFPTYDVLGKVVDGKYLRPLNHSYIPNLAANVWETLQNPFYDQKSQYSVPYVLYSTGIAYRRDMLASSLTASDDLINSSPNPRALLWDPTYKDKVGVYDSERDTIAFALQKVGIQDVNTENPADLDKAQAALLDLIQQVNVRTAIVLVGSLAKGDFVLTESWSGDAVGAWGGLPKYTEAAYETLGYWYPADHTAPIDNDTIAVGASGDNPVLAHLFLNHVLDFQTAMDNFSWTCYQPPQKQADVATLTSTEGLYSKMSAAWAAPRTYVPKWMPNAVVTEDALSNSGAYRIHELSPAGDSLWSDVWQVFKAGG